MPSRAQIMLMAVGFRKKPIGNIMSVSFDPAKQSCIGIFYELSTPPVTHLSLRCLHVSFIISQNHVKLRSNNKYKFLYALVREKKVR